jgi:hypothetical protein
MYRRDDIGLLCSVSPAGNDIIASMRNAILQAVIEVPMSRRQALAATRTMLAIYGEHGIEDAKLTGHSILRGLSFIELVLTLPPGVALLEVAGVALMGFTISAEGAARSGESEEFAVTFAEIFWEGEEHQPEPVLLGSVADQLGIGGMSEEKDFEWAKLLSRYYNPVVRRHGEVRIKR